MTFTENVWISVPLMTVLPKPSMPGLISLKEMIRLWESAGRTPKPIAMTSPSATAAMTRTFIDPPQNQFVSSEFDSFITAKLGTIDCLAVLDAAHDLGGSFFHAGHRRDPVRF
jgi:hypothetical protein